VTLDRSLTAPGKLFLAGEYAVLWGGAARIAALAPRSAARVRRRADREVHLVLAEGRQVGDATPLGVRWREPVPPGFHFAARTLDLAFRAYGRESVGLELAMAPGIAGPGGRKLGLGGSARATVLAAEAARYVLEASFDPLKLALLAHHSAQGGKGSGGDVAAIFAGGVVRYRRYPVESLDRAGELPSALASSSPVDLWRLPSPRLHLAYAFAGQSASTRELIGKVEERLDEAARAEVVRKSDALGQALETGLLQGDFPAVREAAIGLHQLLCTLGPLETEEIRRVLALARSYDCAGKISGAGGGDGCILFAPSQGARAALIEGLSARGLLALPLELEPGLRGESVPDSELSAWL
jgi:phosphomevalonate kinase